MKGKKYLTRVPAITIIAVYSLPLLDMADMINYSIRTALL